MARPKGAHGVRVYLGTHGSGVDPSIHRAVGPLPASRVGTKILVRRSMFDRWLEGHQVKSVDITCIVDELVTAVKRTN
jgi:hypothetical protein